MCEKNFEGKVLSPSSTDSDDINEEIIISDDITEDDKDEKNSSDKNLKDYFIFTGRIPYREVPKYISAFNLGIYLMDPSEINSPMKVFEYMACEKAVIVTDCPTFNFVKDSNTGVTVVLSKPRIIADQIIDLPAFAAALLMP